MDNCIFCKIRNGEIKSEIVYKDEDFMLIKDIEPQAKVHLLAIPTKHIGLIENMPEDYVTIIGKVMGKVSHMQEKLGLTNGYRLIINQGKDANQTVNHLHIHILGGEKLKDF